MLIYGVAYGENVMMVHAALDRKQCSSLHVSEKRGGGGRNKHNSFECTITIFFLVTFHLQIGRKINLRKARNHPKSLKSPVAKKHPLAISPVISKCQNTGATLSPGVPSGTAPRNCPVLLSRPLWTPLPTALKCLITALITSCMFLNYHKTKVN